jgi:hypothetical protein
MLMIGHLRCGSPRSLALRLKHPLTASLLAGSRRLLQGGSQPRSLALRLKHPLPASLVNTLPDENWARYDARYQAVHRHTKETSDAATWNLIREQRFHEDRYHWRQILKTMLLTSPVSVARSIRHICFTTVILLPHQCFHWKDRLGELLPSDVAEKLLDMLTSPALAQCVQYVDHNQGTLLQAFGVYSTFLFLVLSLRLTSSITAHNVAVTAFSDVCTQAARFVDATQLYFTDNRISNEATLWAYALPRAAQCEMHRVRGEEARPMYEHLLLGHAETSAPEKSAGLEFVLCARRQRARVEGLISAPDQPSYVLQQLTAGLRVAFDQGVITNIRALIAVHARVGEMHAALKTCRRVQRQPEPYSYASIVKVSSMLWMAALPFTMMPTLQLATVPVRRFDRMDPACVPRWPQ